MENIIEQVYGVFGDELPKSRSAYSATVKKPFPVLTITKAFKTWSKFEAAYHTYAISKRTKAVAQKVVKKVTKDVVKKST